MVVSSETVLGALPAKFTMPANDGDDTPGAAEDQPSARSLATSTVVDRDARVRVGIEREVWRGTFGAVGTGNVLVRQLGFVLAGAAATAAPAGFARENPRGVSVNCSSAR
jgi:hypothetical protein